MGDKTGEKPPSQLDLVAKMMAENPQKAMEFVEKEIKEEMLGTYSLDFMKRYADAKKGSKILVNGAELYYETVGDGPHPVLLCPGTTGTIVSDFLPMMLPGGFDRKAFTVVAWDPRGYGNSQVPQRTSYPVGWMEDDAKDGTELMQKLGHKMFSWIGWCAGGNIGYVAAALFPDSILSVVAFGAYPIITQKNYDAAQAFQIHFSKWSKQMLEPKLMQYKEEYVKNLFQELFKFKCLVYESHNGDCCKKYLTDVKCPVLLLQMKLDFLVDQPVIDCQQEMIKNIKLHVIEDGKHAFHLKHPDKFRALVEPFLKSIPL